MGIIRYEQEATSSPEPLTRSKTLAHENSPQIYLAVEYMLHLRFVLDAGVSGCYRRAVYSRAK